MANLIDTTYFNDEVLIAGVETLDVSASLCDFIKKYEPIMLKKAMGYEFYKLFESALQSNPTSGRWYDLVVGADFYMGTTLYEWEGLKDDTLKKSIIANYVYYFYQRNELSNTARLGEVRSNAENATRVTAEYKMINAWNYMVRQVHIMRDYLANKKDGNGDLVYPEYSESNVDCLHFSTLNTFGI